MDLHRFNAQLLWPRLRQELPELWQCSERFLSGLLYILRPAFCSILVSTKGFTTQSRAFLFGVLGVAGSWHRSLKDCSPTAATGTQTSSYSLAGPA